MITYTRITKNSAGFTLLEIIIAIALSSLIALVLYTTFWQTQKTVKGIQALVAADMTQASLYYQLERDIMGFFLPSRAIKKVPKHTTSLASPTQEILQDKEKQEVSSPPITHVLYSAQERDMLNLLTFISTSSLPVFVDPRQQESPIYAVRITYRLRKDPYNNHLYILTRHESTDLTFKVSPEPQKMRASEYEIARNIRTVRITYWFKEHNKSNTSSKAYTAVHTWSVDEQLQRKQEPLFPEFMKFEITFSQDGKEYSTYFLYKIPVMAPAFVKETSKENSNEQHEIKEPEKPEEEKKS